MKYRFTHLPNTQKARTFKVNSLDGKNESVYCVSRKLVDIWGNPEESKIEQLIIAHIKKNGWAKQPVAIDAKDYSRSLTYAIASLSAPKKK